MKVRLISGQYGGRVLDAPANNKTHPMSERVRGSMFNIISGQIEGAAVLDVFAGSGALGLEALSRGAETAMFIENDRIAQKTLQTNIDKLDLSKRSKVVKSSVDSWLKTAPLNQYDIIFADPPYHDTQFSTVARLFGYLKPGGCMILSHPGKGEVPIQDGIVVVDNRSYGNAYLTFFRRDA